MAINVTNICKRKAMRRFYASCNYNLYEYTKGHFLLKEYIKRPNTRVCNSDIIASIIDEFNSEIIGCVSLSQYGDNIHNKKIMDLKFTNINSKYKNVDKYSNFRSVYVIPLIYKINLSHTINCKYSNIKNKYNNSMFHKEMWTMKILKY